nr:unnamed protein product [Callosobruchus analis]
MATTTRRTKPASRNYDAEYNQGCTHKNHTKGSKKYSRHAGSPYASVNSCKAALSFILDVKEDSKTFLGRLMKGLYNQRPIAPRYEATWDPHTVLEFLEKWYPLESHSLFQLSLKLVALLALTSGHRIQTFSKIMVNDVILGDDTVKIKISAKLKTSKINRAQPILDFPFFKDKPALCVAATIAYYLERTKDIRPKGELKLILTHKKPHNAATAQTLSRWLKWVLKNSNIDTNIFKGYSFRHASTSAALRGGANIETIRKSAGWTNKSETFNRFYNRPVVSGVDFIQGVFLGSNINVSNNNLDEPKKKMNK